MKKLKLSIFVLLCSGFIHQANGQTETSYATQIATPNEVIGRSAVKLNGFSCMGNTQDAFVTFGTANDKSVMLVTASDGEVLYDGDIEIVNAFGSVLNVAFLVQDVAETTHNQYFSFTGTVYDATGSHMSTGIFNGCGSHAGATNNHGTNRYTLESGTAGVKVMAHPTDVNKFISFGTKKNGPADYTLVVQEYNLTTHQITTKIHDINFKVSDATVSPDDANIIVLSGVSLNTSVMSAICENENEMVGQRGLTLVSYNTSTSSIDDFKSYGSESFIDTRVGEFISDNEHDVTIESFRTDKNVTKYFVTTNVYSESQDNLFNDRRAAIAVFDKKLENVSLHSIETPTKPNNGLINVRFNSIEPNELGTTIHFKELYSGEEDIMTFSFKGKFNPLVAKVNSLTGTSHNPIDNYSSTIGFDNQSIAWFTSFQGTSYTGLNPLQGFSNCSYPIDVVFKPLCMGEVGVDHTPGYTSPVNSRYIMRITRALPILIEDKCSDISKSASQSGNTTGINGYVAELSVHPNPAAESITISFEDRNFVGPIVIQNALGKTVYTLDHTSETGSSLTVNISDFAPGVYYIKHQYSENRTQMGKFVKQ